MTLVDASVAFKWFVPEEGASEAQSLLIESAEVAAPELILGEVGNALWKAHRRGVISADDYRLSFEDLGRSFTRLHRLGPLTMRASEIARALDHPIYDCYYLACAERRQERLVTADKRLLAVVAETEFAELLAPLA